MTKRWLGALVSVISIGCVGTDVGNPEDVTETGFILTTEVVPEIPLPNGLILEGAKLDEAWVSVSAIELRVDCSAARAEVVEGPFFVDLLNPGTPIPANLSASDYCRVEFQLESHPDAPELLRGRTLFLAGSRTDGVPFEVSGTKADALRFKGVQERAIGIPHMGNVISDLSVMDWIASGGLDDEAVPVEVSELTPSVYNRFSNDLKQRSKLFSDKNGDKSLGAEEVSPVATGD